MFAIENAVYIDIKRFGYISSTLELVNHFFRFTLHRDFFPQPKIKRPNKSWIFCPPQKEFGHLLCSHVRAFIKHVVELYNFSQSRWVLKDFMDKEHRCSTNPEVNRTFPLQTAKHINKETQTLNHERLRTSQLRHIPSSIFLVCSKKLLHPSPGCDLLGRSRIPLTSFLPRNGWSTNSLVNEKFGKY